MGRDFVMTYIARITLIFCLLSGCAILVQAQSINAPPPPKRKFKHNGKVETAYDKAKNETVVYLRPMPVGLFIKEPGFPNAPVVVLAGMRMSMLYSYPGKAEATPPQVTLGFVLSYPDIENLSDYGLRVKADGQLLSLGLMKRVTSRPSKSGPQYVAVELALPYDKFLQIANATKVEMNVGIINLDLSENHLEAIRDLASRTGSAAQATARDDGVPSNRQKAPDKSDDSGESENLNGKAITLPRPEYPEPAKRVRASGTVKVLVTVDEKGNVVSARPVSGHPLLQPAALESARRAKFAPTTREGQPVNVVGMIIYVFSAS